MYVPVMASPPAVLMHPQPTAAEAVAAAPQPQPQPVSYYMPFPYGYAAPPAPAVTAQPQPQPLPMPMAVPHYYYPPAAPPGMVMLASPPQEGFAPPAPASAPASSSASITSAQRPTLAPPTPRPGEGQQGTTAQCYKTTLCKSYKDFERAIDVEEDEEERRARADPQLFADTRAEREAARRARRAERLRQFVCPYGVRCRFAHGQADKRTYTMNVNDGLTSEERLTQYLNLLEKNETILSSRAFLAQHGADVSMLRPHEYMLSEDNSNNNSINMSHASSYYYYPQQQHQLPYIYSAEGSLASRKFSNASTTDAVGRLSTSNPHEVENAEEGAVAARFAMVCAPAKSETAQGVGYTISTACRGEIEHHMKGIGGGDSDHDIK